MGEVCELLGIRPHTIRYWERSVPFIAARRNAFGRRVFGARWFPLLIPQHLVHFELPVLREALRRAGWHDGEVLVHNGDILAESLGGTP